jgi:hypothetical protein
MDLNECEREGEAAGRDGIPASDCPYMFAKAGVDQRTFDAVWRPKLNAWFVGWKRTAPPPRKNPRRGGVRKAPNPLN